MVIGYGGFFGVHVTLKLAPTQLISAATTKSQTLAINATTMQWRNAPAFKYSALAAIAEQDRASENFQAFSILGQKRGETLRCLALKKPGAIDLVDTYPAQLKFASDVIGLRVVNQKREKMGEVVDLLVSFGEPRPAFAIISTGRLFDHQRQYAVPLQTLSLSKNELTWNVDAAALQSAPHFDEAAWEARGGDGRAYGYSTSAD